ncbi:phosphoesterase, Icc protein-like protein [Desulfovibrio ferrophilus]|uniref:Phosphoesterase, Icc protein-like protein n=1 Tax=Desulfovibrio ferrophilus TaxID=241368 RepID=A0A2Z6AVN6_9BACT|nr:phosphoesterase, Icc protein-like protein [Desulfovibrio ferrophilus]
MKNRDECWIGVGDIHGQAQNISRIPGVTDARGVIMSGDMTTHGSVDDARRVMDVLQKANPVVLAQIGNMDSPGISGWLEEKGVNIHAEARELAPGFGLIGVGWSAPTPFGTPCEVPDATLGHWLNAVHARASDWKRLLLVVHTPPYGTRVDDLGGGRHVGSPAVREFIERVQPDACLTGHIHESRALDYVGKTPVVNPGMLAHGGYAQIRLTADELSIELKTL